MSDTLKDQSHESGVIAPQAVQDAAVEASARRSRLFQAGWAAWVIIVLLCLVMLVVITPNSYRLVAGEWQVSTSYRAVNQWVSYPNYVVYVLVIRYLALGVFLVVALVIFWRRSHDRMAIFTSATLVLLPTTLLFLGETENLFSQTPWNMIFRYMQGFITTAAIAGMVLFVYLFPDGKFAPHWISRLVLPALAIQIILFVIAGSGLAGEAHWWLMISMIVIVLVGSVPAQVYRYRRLASAYQRQQIKWVLFAIAILAAGFLGMVLLGFLGEENASTLTLVNIASLHLNVLILAFIPFSIGISILRYRLWDIDVIIRRTLVYGGLTATLAVVYFGSVILMQGLFMAVSGRPTESTLLATQRSPVVIVISTLVIAALFNPLRKRIQNDIDRRFFRKKYDAEKVVAAFAASLREEVDLEDLQNQIVVVVEETLQPERVSLWLRSSEDKRIRR